MSISTVDHDGSASISALHPDIIRAHILTRLDGPTLASAASASVQLHSLSRDPSLWSNICSTTWPSTNEPRVQDAIASFPDGHCTFFSDSFSLLTTTRDDHDHSQHRVDRVGRDRDHHELESKAEMISAVDLRYKGELVLSKVVSIEIESNWFDHSPFLVELLHQKDAVATRMSFSDDNDTCRDIAEGLELSWIVVDLAGNRRAANLAGGGRPVSVQRHPLSGDVQVRFAAVVVAGRRGSSSEFVQFGISVTCGGSHDGFMHVKEVCLGAEDMDGNYLMGRDISVILRRAMRGKRGKGVGKEAEGKKIYENYLKRKRERKEKNVRNERFLDFLCASLFGGLAVYVLFWVTMRVW